MFFSTIFNLFFLIIIFLNLNSCVGMELTPTDNDTVFRTPEKKKPIVFSTPEKKARTLQEAYLDNDPTYLSPTSQQHFKALSKELKGPIINPHTLENIKKRRLILSPFVRKNFNRRETLKLKKKGIVISLPANAYSEYVELPPETQEEKNARKKRQLEYFQSLNNLDYSIFTDLSQREATYWVPYWNFIKIEKEKALNKQRGKLRPEELEDVAQAVSLIHYQSFEVADTIFYYHLDFLDFSIKDSLGRTNTRRLKQGLNPIGIDGLSMEIHHLTMFDDSILVLLSRTLHEGGPLKTVANDNTATFHPQPTYYGRSRSSDIDRVRFAKIVKEICSKLVQVSKDTLSTDMDTSVPVDDTELDDLFMGEDVDDIEPLSFEDEEEQFFPVQDPQKKSVPKNLFPFQ